MNPFSTFQWPQDTAKPTPNGLATRSHLVCADGFSVSVQARASAYCTPRDNQGPWTEVELGFPSEADELIQPYSEDSNNLTDTVYPWVPVEVVDAPLTKHGGVQ